MAYYPIFRLMARHRAYICINFSLMKAIVVRAAHGNLWVFNQCCGRIWRKLHHRVGRFTKRTRPSGVSVLGFKRVAVERVFEYRPNEWLKYWVSCPYASRLAYAVNFGILPERGGH